MQQKNPKPKKIETIVSQETNTNDNWTVAVSSTDTNKETTVVSNALIIQNAAPTISNVLLNATTIANSTNDNVTLTFSASDADGEIAYNSTDFRKLKSLNVDYLLVDINNFSALQFILREETNINIPFIIIIHSDVPYQTQLSKQLFVRSKDEYVAIWST